MEEFVVKKNIIGLILRIIPFFTLELIWAGIESPKVYYGARYLWENRYTCAIGFIIIFGIIFLKKNLKIKISINILGNLIFWFPLFYSAFFGEDKLSVAYYLSIIIVVFCVFLQSYIFRKSVLV